MSGHTPGPWLIEYDNDVGERDEYFVEWFDVGPARIIFDTRMGEMDRAEADARLIAAAPDLLAAARKALNYIENTEGELGTTLDSGDALRAAIALAEPKP